MTVSSEAALDAARRHWERVLGSAETPDEVALAADRMCAQLRAGLGRWIGDAGYRSLFERALRVTRTDHPALAQLSFDAGDQVATSAEVRAHGTREVAAGMVALVGTVIQLLGRIIGEEMALRLVEHWGDRARADIVSNDTEDGRDG